MLTDAFGTTMMIALLVVLLTGTTLILYQILTGHLPKDEKWGKIFGIALIWSMGLCAFFLYEYPRSFVGKFFLVLFPSLLLVCVYFMQRARRTIIGKERTETSPAHHKPLT